MDLGFSSDPSWTDRWASTVKKQQQQQQPLQQQQQQQSSSYMLWVVAVVACVALLFLIVWFYRRSTPSSRTSDNLTSHVYNTPASSFSSGPVNNNHNYNQRPESLSANLLAQLQNPENTPASSHARDSGAVVDLEHPRHSVRHLSDKLYDSMSKVNALEMSIHQLTVRMDGFETLLNKRATASDKTNERLATTEKNVHRIVQKLQSQPQPQPQPHAFFQPQPQVSFQAQPPGPMFATTAAAAAPQPPVVQLGQ